MRTANEYEIAIFKKEYCKNGEARISIGKDFEVDVESFEELLPGKIVSSYATGNRDIENSFIMFRVCNVIKDIQYFPVFSETVGRKMLKSWNKPVPKKRSIFIEDSNGVQREHNKKLNNGLPILHKVPPKRDYGRYFCIMAKTHWGLTEKLSPFFHAKKQEVNAYGR